MNSDADLNQVLGQLHDLGVYLAIEDFGTEYSSLARLRDLPVEVLKIDRSFVDGLGVEAGDTAIVASIMSLAFAMGLHVIAEGVETEAQASYLRAHNVDFAQGWLLGKAQPAEQFKAYYRENKQPRDAVPDASRRAIAALARASPA